jgi:hypothetical protein
VTVRMPGEPEEADVAFRWTDVSDEMAVREALKAQEQILNRMAQVVPMAATSRSRCGPRARRPGAASCRLGPCSTGWAT